MGKAFFILGKMMKIIGKDDSKKKFNEIFKALDELLLNNIELQKLAPDYIVLGGDGSLNYFLNNELDSSTESSSTVLYIPDGTANDFAKSLGLSLENIDKLDAAYISDIFLSQKKITCPIMSCNDHLFINTVTMGAPAKVTDSGKNNLKEVLGQWSYYLSAIEEVFEHEILEFTIRDTKENKEMKFKGPGIIVGQGLYAGGGVKVTDVMNPLFGENFFVTVATDVNISGTIKSVIKMQLDRLDNKDDITSFSFTNKVEFYFDREVMIKIDGEPFEYKNISFAKTKKKLDFLIF